MNEIKRHAEEYTNETENAINYNESNLMLIEAINQLPARCKEIFIKCRLEGVSYKDASVQLGIAESTINNQMVKALKYIRKYLTIKNTAILFLIIFLKIFE